MYDRRAIKAPLPRPANPEPGPSSFSATARDQMNGAGSPQFATNDPLLPLLMASGVGSPPVSSEVMQQPPDMVSIPAPRQGTTVPPPRRPGYEVAGVDPLMALITLLRGA